VADDYADVELRDDWYPDPDDPWEYEDDANEEDPCSNCGMSCPHWLGDNLCDLEIERQVEVSADFHKRFVSRVHCPVCGKELLQVSLPTDRLWIWPGGDWDFAGEFMLALELFGTIYSDKGVIHETEPNEDYDYIIYHCWRYSEDDQFLLKLRKPTDGGEAGDE
jgi:hypothetical protein